MRGEFEISGGEVRVCAHLQARAVAVIPRRRRMDFDFGLKFEFGEAAKVLAQDFFFDLKLMFVSGVLVMASATAGKVRAGRRDAMRRGFNNCRRVGAGEAGLLFGERGFDFLSGENKGNEDGFAATVRVGGKASEAVSAVDELFNV